MPMLNDPTLQELIILLAAEEVLREHLRKDETLGFVNPFAMPLFAEWLPATDSSWEFTTETIARLLGEELPADAPKTIRLLRLGLRDAQLGPNGALLVALASVKRVLDAQVGQAPASASKGDSKPALIDPKTFFWLNDLERAKYDREPGDTIRSLEALRETVARLTDVRPGGLVLPVFVAAGPFAEKLARRSGERCEEAPEERMVLDHLRRTLADWPPGGVLAYVDPHGYGDKNSTFLSPDAYAELLTTIRNWSGDRPAVSVLFAGRMPEMTTLPKVIHERAQQVGFPTSVAFARGVYLVFVAIRPRAGADTRSIAEAVEARVIDHWGWWLRWARRGVAGGKPLIVYRDGRRSV